MRNIGLMLFRKRPALPKVENENFVKTPVDQFILSKLEEKNGHPVSLKKRKSGFGVSALVSLVYLQRSKNLRIS